MVHSGLLSSNTCLIVLGYSKVAEEAEMEAENHLLREDTE